MDNEKGGEILVVASCLGFYFGILEKTCEDEDDDDVYPMRRFVTVFLFCCVWWL